MSRSRRQSGVIIPLSDRPGRVGGLALRPTAHPGLAGPGDCRILRRGQSLHFGAIHPRDTILDIGCGAGVDTIIAALMVGQSGSVTGIDLVPEMPEREKEKARLARSLNVEFMEVSAEELPFSDNTFDVVISNGVINLVVDKFKALGEVYRVLKPGGRFMLTDQVLAGELPKDTKARIENWAR
jgi:arsenite methyltransferase